MSIPLTLKDDLETELISLVNDIPHKNTEIIRTVIKAFLEKYLRGGKGFVRVHVRQDGSSIFYIQIEVVGLEDGSWNAEFELLT